MPKESADTKIGKTQQQSLTIIYDVFHRKAYTTRKPKLGRPKDRLVSKPPHKINVVRYRLRYMVDGIRIYTYAINAMVV